MDSFLDRAWNVIYVFLSNTVVFMDSLFSPLEILGPEFVIFVLAFFVVIFTRIIGKFYVTKRYIKLKKDYKHWQGVREEAMKHPDRKKGKALAKNVDQAELNKAYYDYFFEGLLKHFMVNVLPILLVVSYVTTVYTPANLLERFGKQWVFSFSFGSSSTVNVSSMLWFVICIILSYIIFAILKMVIKKLYAKKSV
ncbi:MAG: hypothetical protein HOG03_17755 [Desulfobacula sp.]|jgi:hypothetical protein|uniref:hypothetical protein n=1 Tax=Desulfobacula sp. TaxID=2593537 RepID=UPI001D8BB0A5|nr:hypothetical protein [Desulfobacula sp.]MBT3486503.1 hypothetical protein [Desulfobacula sp.]MBT3806425.1 hypothetical protein [Desulfobacula sp.]MBT4023907.1 hypothetical protein [Desulfobacula sp.]MBT4198967.1 hypothetical protein [Desulfobacula sp.]